MWFLFAVWFSAGLLSNTHFWKLPLVLMVTFQLTASHLKGSTVSASFTSPVFILNWKRTITTTAAAAADTLRGFQHMHVLTFWNHAALCHPITRLIPQLSPISAAHLIASDSLWAAAVSQMSGSESSVVFIEQSVLTCVQFDINFSSAAERLEQPVICIIHFS